MPLSDYHYNKYLIIISSLADLPKKVLTHTTTLLSWLFFAFYFTTLQVPPELPIFPKPLPRTSLLRQENVPPLPPPRRRSPRISQTLTKFRELEQLHNYEPSSILRLRELSTNPPKRKICLEPTVECAADDENSFVDWRAFAGTSGGYDTDRKRRKTVRFQNKSLGMLRGSELASGKAKLQLCLYINYGHLSVHGNISHN